MWNYLQLAQEFSSIHLETTWGIRGSINSSSGKDGVQLFPGGVGGGVSRCLIIPYLSPYNLCFLRGSGLPSGWSPLMQYLGYLDAVTKVRYLKKLSILNLPEYMVSGKTAIEAWYWPKLKFYFFPLTDWPWIKPLHKKFYYNLLLRFFF